MVAKSEDPIEDLKGDAKDLAVSASENPWIERWMRSGHAVAGLLYATIGFLAIQLVLTGRGSLTDKTGALATIASQPFGEIILILVVAGLVGYAVWGFVRAVLDPYRRGSDLKGIAARLGYLFVGISYASLVIPAVKLIIGPDVDSGQESEQMQQAASGILAQTWGPWVVGIAGAAILVIGGINVYRGLSEKFVEYFQSYRMSPRQKRWAVRMGKVGYIAIGIVLGIIGFLAILAALSADAEKIAGFDGALTFLLQQPYGPWLIGIVAVGLIAYAVYSIMGAFWFRIRH